MSKKPIPIENQEFPQDDFAQDAFDDFGQDSHVGDEVWQDVGSEFSQDSGYDEFAQHEPAEIQRPQRKKR